MSGGDASHHTALFISVMSAGVLMEALARFTRPLRHVIASGSRNTTHFPPVFL